MVAVGVVKSSLDDSINIEPIVVPSVFAEKGYSPQISTIRLVDELKQINSLATTTKSRSSIAGKAPGEEIAKMNPLPIGGGIDINSIQSALRDFLGVKSHAISGDITYLGKPDDNKYQVRIRKTPENTLLVDDVFTGEPSVVLKAVAIKIIEKLDPVVAASYFRNHKNTKDALRCIDLALTNDNPADDTYALSQRAQIYLRQKQFELSKRDLDDLLKIDPQSPQGLGVLSFWYNEQRLFKQGLEYAEKQMQAKPDMWHAYFNKADALIGLGLEAEEVLLKGIQLKPNRADAYIDAADYFEKKGKLPQAIDLLKSGAGRFPASFDMNLQYGLRLLKDGHKDVAMHYLEKANELQPDHPAVKKIIDDLKLKFK